MLGCRTGVPLDARCVRPRDLLGQAGEPRRLHFLEDPLSSKLESERRLFYVAITRTRKGVFIGAGGRPSRFLAEIQLEEIPTQ